MITLVLFERIFTHDIFLFNYWFSEFKTDKNQN